MTSETWQGMPHTDIERDADRVPPDPRVWPPEPAGRTPTRYPRVTFSGVYVRQGATTYQEFTRYNLTRAEARWIAWAAFGHSAHLVVYYDACGSIVAIERGDRPPPAASGRFDPPHREHLLLELRGVDHELPGLAIG